MTIILALLICQLRFPIGQIPSDSYEIGHYAPTFAATFETAFASELTCDLVWGIPKSIPSALLRSGVCAGIGVLGGSVAYYFLKNHYQTADEQYWGERGCADAVIATFAISIPMYYYKKAVEKRVATACRLKELTEDMEMDYLPDGRPFWHSKNLVEVK